MPDTGLTQYALVAGAAWKDQDVEPAQVGRGELPRTNRCDRVAELALDHEPRIAGDIRLGGPVPRNRDADVSNRLHLTAAEVHAVLDPARIGRDDVRARLPREPIDGGPEARAVIRHLDDQRAGRILGAVLRERLVRTQYEQVLAQGPSQEARRGGLPHGTK